VNAGSNTISVFAVRGDRLALRQVLSSGGTFPVSVVVYGNLVYVLNALNGGSLLHRASQRANLNLHLLAAFLVEQRAGNATRTVPASELT
jgi:hypothetical protein